MPKNSQQDQKQARQKKNSKKTQKDFRYSS